MYPILFRIGDFPITTFGLMMVTLACVFGATPAHAQGGFCFDLALSDWSDDRALRADSLTFAPPPRVLLDTTRARGPFYLDDAFLLRPAPDALPSIHRMAWWRVLEGDSIELLWSTGYAGLHARLAREGDGLVGIAETSTDVIPEHPAHATIAATRIACDAPLAEGDRFGYRYPRGVAIEGADSIRVGLALNRAGMEIDSVRNTVVRIRNAPRGAWEGADSMTVFLDDERVESIWVTYPAGSWNEVFARLERELGPPITFGPGRGEGCPPFAYWADRLVTIFFAGHHADGCGDLPRIRIRGARRR